MRRGAGARPLTCEHSTSWLERILDSRERDGVASYALELLRTVPDLDAVYVGVGMGSGIWG